VTADECAVSLALVGLLQGGRKFAVAAKHLDLGGPRPTDIFFQNEVDQKPRANNEREQGAGQGLTDAKWAKWVQWTGLNPIESAKSLEGQTASQSANEC
jgi:hypothetical protein